MEKNNTVEEYIEKHPSWKKELNTLRSTLLSTDLNETIKWRAPVYTIKKKNVVGLGAFKNHIALWFFDGALLKDTHNCLRNSQEGKTQAMRQLRFEKNETIDLQLVSAYVDEAIKNQREGKRVKRTKKPLIIPTELSNVLKKDSNHEKAFEKLSISKRREYVEQISSAKQEKKTS